MKVAFIINGKRLVTETIKDTIRKCKTHPTLDVYQFETGKQKDAIRLATACAENGFDYIIAVGGDGTVNEVLNGIMLFDGKKPKIGIIPNGTGNDFIAGTKMTVNLDAFIPALLNNTSEKIDIGRITTNSKTYHFINIADIGFGGKVIHTLNKQRKFIKGNWPYSLAVLRTFIGYRKPVLSIKADDFEYQGSVFMLAICNGQIFGNGLTINPTAKINDGFFNLTFFGNVSFFHYIWNLKSLKKGIEIIHPEVKYLQAKKIEVKIIHGHGCTETDGEFVGCMDISLEILPECVELVWY